MRDHKELILKQSAMKKIHENLKETGATKPLSRVTSGNGWLYSDERKWISKMNKMENGPAVAMCQENTDEVLDIVMKKCHTKNPK
jgi:nitrogen regulatory protein PII